MQAAIRKLGPAGALALVPAAERAAFRYRWDLWSRPEQRAPRGNYTAWVVLAGRGFGKTRCGAEWVREQAESGRAKRIALVARTAADVRDVIVEGESGILACSPPWFRPIYEPSKRRLTWPNGAIATTYSADEPNTLRGPQHDCAWADELAAWPDPDAWDQLLFGLRLGDHPQVAVTTTPRPTKIIRELIAHPTTVTVRGATYDNRVNLAPTFFEQVIARFENTRVGRQELLAEILDDAPGALWKREQIESARIVRVPDLRRIVVAIDPAVTSQEGSDETGIVIAGIDRQEHGRAHVYVLADVSGRFKPDEWARRAVFEYLSRRADRIVAEVNNGGEMVANTIRTVDGNVAFTAVHASRGKAIRAEPIAALYEQGRVHHVGVFAELEDQLCSWEPGGKQRSPDRLDALVWAITELLIADGAGPVEELYRDV